MTLLTLLVQYSDGAEIRSTTEPSDTRFVYSAAKMPMFVWVFAFMDAGGFATPAEGDSFAFSDYLNSVPDNKPEKSDLCYFSVEGVKGFGIVASVLDDQVSVVIPPHNGVMAIRPINVNDVLWFLRPSKRIQPKDKQEQL